MEDHREDPVLIKLSSISILLAGTAGSSTRRSHFRDSWVFSFGQLQLWEAHQFSRPLRALLQSASPQRVPLTQIMPPLRWKSGERPGKRATSGWDHKRIPVSPNRCVLAAASPVPLGSADNTSSVVNTTWGTAPEKDPAQPLYPGRASHPSTSEGYRDSWLNRCE